MLDEQDTADDERDPLRRVAMAIGIAAEDRTRRGEERRNDARPLELENAVGEMLRENPPRRQAEERSVPVTPTRDGNASGSRQTNAQH